MNRLKGSILVIDDSMEYQLIVSEVLENEGYTVNVMSDGASALDAIESINPDLILLDIVMPGMSGYDVCDVIKGIPKFSDIPIIFLTTLDSTADEIKGLEHGAADYIRKPISVPVLKARVKSYIQLRQYIQFIKNKNSELKILNEDLNTFSYTLTHDLKNPIGIIQMYSNFIYEKFESIRMTKEWKTFK